MINKTTSIPFLDSIPETWDCIPNRYLFKENTKKVGNRFSEYQLLSLTTQGVKEKDINSSGGKVPDSYEKYLSIKKGQMIFCLFDLDVSAVFSGISGFDGMITSAYNAFDSKGIINNEYSDYWFKYVFTNRFYKIYSKNIRYTVTGDTFNSICTPVPPKDTQNKIVEILKEKEEKINQLISNQEKQIEKLNEYKQSLIYELITRGSDKDTLLRDSGVFTIGKIADHYKLMKLKYVANICDELRKPVSADSRKQESEILYDYYGASGVIDKIDGYTLDGHYMLIGEDGANLRMRNLPLMYEVDGKAWINNHAHVLKPKDLLLFDYLFFALESLDINPYITGSAQPKLNQENLKNIILPVPNYEEQKEIVKLIKRTYKKTERLIEIKNDKIMKLNEYKKTLIYEYVTGKREA